MEVQQDFRELFALLNENAVEYLVVGAYALAFHGAPRFTGDIDIYVRPTRDNAQRIYLALEAFGFRSPDLSAEDFVRSERVVQIGVPPVRIDLMTSITGISWEEAESGKAAGGRTWPTWKRWEKRRPRPTIACGPGSLPGCAPCARLPPERHQPPLGRG